jgi:hypothetical protein
VRKKLDPPLPKQDIPKLSEEERERLLGHHTASLRRILQQQREAKEGMFGSFAALIGDPEEKDRARLIWKGLVRFTNEDLSADTKGILGIFALRAALALCVYDDQEFDEVKGDVFQLEFFEDVYIRQTRLLVGEQHISTISVRISAERQIRRNRINRISTLLLEEPANFRIDCRPDCTIRL